MPVPVIVVASGGVPVINTPFSTPMTPIALSNGGMPVTVVAAGGFPVHLVNDDLSDWAAPAFASGVLSFNGNASDGEVVTIGVTAYRFVTILAVPYDVLIGASASISILNLIAAISAGAGEGTVYGTGTMEHPDVTASVAPGIMNVTAKVIGPAGNAIVTDSTSVTATWGAATLQGGA